jgi:hypothetical protein
MKQDNSDLEDELLSEYDLKSLRVRKLGSGRKSFGSEVIRLKPDVADVCLNSCGDVAGLFHGDRSILT